MARTAQEIAAEAEALRAKGAEQEDDTTDDVVVEDEDDGAGDKSPPGFLSYEDYIKSGKDPKKYKGEDAYKETYEHIHEIKSLKKELKVVAQSVSDTMEEWRNAERAKLKEEAKQELEQAKASGDVNAVLEAKEKLDEIKQDEKKGVAPKLLPVIEDYIQDNPLIDAQSKDFNQDVFEDFKLLYDAQVTKLTNGTGIGMTERQIQRALTRALEEAKEMNKEALPQVRSPRNDRAGPGRTNKGGDPGKGQSLEVRLKNLKFADNRNTDGNPHPAYATFMKMKETNPKAAERFARNLLGDN
jgi:hypothetical protein